MNDILVGRVYSIVYTQDGYYILNFDAEGHRNVKVKGNLYGLLQVKPGISIKLLGKWQFAQKYGKEFLIQTWEPWASSPKEVVEFLNVCVKEFSDLTLVDALVNAHGLDTFEQLTKLPDVVLGTKYPKVSKEALAKAVLSWGTVIATRDLSVLLREGGLGAMEVQAALIRFGSEAPQIIADNPYRLMEILGFSFSKIDRLAIHLGCKHNDPRRIQGMVLWALQEASKQGHLYLRRGELGQHISELAQKDNLILSLAEPAKAYDAAVVQLVKQKSAMLDVESGLYLPQLFDFERKSAAYIASRLNPSPVLQVDTTTFIQEYERSHKLRLSDAQRTAVELLTQNRALAITGLPGTGKTTVLRALVRLLEDAKISFRLMAPTGIAAKRLASVTGHEAHTVHRALRFDGINWGHNENNHFITEAVILDEASMVDQELLYRLLSALRSDTRIILVGDDAQLPSVGPGNVLRELIDCKAMPHVRLTEIFRQAAQGEIVINSHKINSGKMPELSIQDKESEFRFVRISDEAKIAALIVEMAVKLKSRDANFQVLSPKYDGVVGVDNLNELLRDALNPEGPKEWSNGKQRFREGDRLMVVQNDYKLKVYNGDVGKLRHVYRDSLLVKIHGLGAQMEEDINFPEATAGIKLRLAYAITAHKSQGSEFDTIIMPIVKTQGRMLQRNLLYTAVTRAKKRVWLIGEETAVQKAIENNKVVRRNTILSKAISNNLVAVSVPVGENQ